MSVPMQHQIRIFSVNKIPCSLLSENEEIKLSGLQKLPQKDFAHQYNMQPPFWQKINQMQNGSEQNSEHATKTKRNRTWISAIASESRSLRGNCKQDAKPKRKKQCFLKRLSFPESTTPSKKLQQWNSVKKHVNIQVRKTAGRCAEADIIFSGFKN